MVKFSYQNSHKKDAICIIAESLLESSAPIAFFFLLDSLISHIAQLLNGP